MKTKLMLAGLSLQILSSQLWASSAGREDSSNGLIWAFLGICGLIIFLQMVPVITMTYGLIKGVFSGKRSDMEEELEVATSKYQ
mgnify:CR=1 FL=1